MPHLQCATPFFIEIFANQAPVAMMWRGLRAKEACTFKYLWLELGYYGDTCIITVRASEPRLAAQAAG
jgi:hypothetical protein